MVEYYIVKLRGNNKDQGSVIKVKGSKLERKMEVFAGNPDSIKEYNCSFDSSGNFGVDQRYSFRLILKEEAEKRRANID